jgi:hypothetical protein
MIKRALMMFLLAPFASAETPAVRPLNFADSPMPILFLRAAPDDHSVSAFYSPP